MIRERHTPRYGQLQTTFYRLGYRWFNTGDYNLNIIGLRSRDTDSNTFNDLLCVAYRVDDMPQVHCFAATTDPGLYWRKHPMHVDGTAVLAPGQYLGCWKLGLHQNTYTALVQQSPMTVYRDNNRDACIDVEPHAVEKQRGLFGINLHRANAKQASLQVDKWSAGCQVLASPVDFSLLIALCRQANVRYGNSFSYTLLHEDELWSL